MNFEGRRVLILGLAREGVSLARFCVERGASVTVTDSAPAERLSDRVAALRPLPIRFVLGGDHPQLLDEADRFFVSPGVPESSAVYLEARRRGITVESMTTLFFDLCPAPIVGVTGSSGKTTTTGLLGHILRAAGIPCAVGGNIGDPMLDLLPSIGRDTTVVLELSSFQLDLLRRSPHIALVTNISPNHLDRHGTMDSYIGAKLNIVRHQSAHDFAVLNARDDSADRFARSTRGAISWFGGEGGGALQRGQEVGLMTDRGFEPVLPVRDIPLLGQHNVENVLAAIAACSLLRVSAPAMAGAIRTYRPAPHRLEVVATRNGVTYVDDSIATSPARAVVGLSAINTPILLIAGGRDKKLPWEEFARAVVARVRALYLIGEAADDIEQAVREAIHAGSGTLSPSMIHRCTSLESAVQSARTAARWGETVLLSPACTSYDMFTDFAERGRVFAHTVEALDAA